jgi:hypothetical protein
MVVCIHSKEPERLNLAFFESHRIKATSEKIRLILLEILHQNVKDGQGASTGFHVTAPALPRSSLSSSSTSVVDSSNSNTFAFEAMRAGCADFGRGTNLVQWSVEEAAGAN